MTIPIIGHKKIITRILDLISDGRFPQTSIWHGQAGSGKKQVARLVARTMLCDSPQKTGDGLSGCGQCRQCLAFASGNHPDFFQIEPTAAKSSVAKRSKTGSLGSIKIEQIKELKHRLTYAPLQALRQVILIDNAELMTGTTANSLLKILEEPRQHQVFILITGQFHRILVTIRSRATRFYFAPLKVSEVKEILKQQDESFASLDDSTLEFFLKAFSGSPAYVARAVASSLTLNNLADASSLKTCIMDVSRLAKTLLQNNVDMPVFLQALRVWRLQNVAKGMEDGSCCNASVQDVEVFERIAAAEAQFARHIQGEFILENLLL